MESELVLHKARTLNYVLSHPGVREAKAKALAAGITIWQIIVAILPFVISFIQTGKIDWQAIVAAILALINPPAPPLHGTRNFPTA